MHRDQDHLQLGLDGRNFETPEFRQIVLKVVAWAGAADRATTWDREKWLAAPVSYSVSNARSKACCPLM